MYYGKYIINSWISRKALKLSLNLLIYFVYQTSKKKYFVVRDESSSGPARLEYYDNDKKFRSGGLARRCILLKNCFSINAKSESTRHRHMIVLYTEDDCFGIACDSESDQMDWLNTMVQLRSHSMNVSCRSPASFSKYRPVSPYFCPYF